MKIKFEGKEIIVPDDASEEEITQILENEANNGMTQHGQDQFDAKNELTKGQPEVHEALPDGNFQGSFMGSMVQGGRDILDAGAQGLYHMLPESVQQAGNQLNNRLAQTGLVGAIPEGGIDEKLRQDEATFQDARERAGRSGIDAGRIVGNVAATLPLVSAKGIQLGQKGVGTLGNILRAGGQGAVVGSAQPVLKGDFATEKLKQAGTGGLFGAGFYPLGSAVGRVLSPKSSKEAQHLLKHGVKPTAGQLLGGGWRSAEDKMMSVPFIGDAIKHGRKESIKELNRAAMSRALRGTGVKAKDIPLGQDGVAKIYSVLDDAYDDVYSKVTFKQDAKFKDAVASISDEVERLGGREAQTYKNLMRDFVSTKLSPDGSMSGETFKKLHTKIRQEATKFSKSQDPYHQDLGILFHQINEEIANAVKRTNPQFADKIGELQRNYANYIRLEKAAGTTSDISEGFTPAMLHRAVRGTDESLRKGRFSKKQALMQDLSGSASTVMNSKIPNSGTVDRFLLAALLGGGGYSLPATAPYMPLVIGGTALASAPALARKSMAGLLAQRPKAFKELSKALVETSPVIGGAVASQN